MTTSYDVDAYVVELRERVRELEAELTDCNRLLGGGLTDAEWLDLICERYALVPKARAEKAERSEEQYRIAYEQQTENVKTFEGRVAELEERIRSVPGFIEGWLGRHKPLAAIEAREREEC